MTETSGPPDLLTPVTGFGSELSPSSDPRGPVLEVCLGPFWCRQGPYSFVVPSSSRGVPSREGSRVSGEGKDTRDGVEWTRDPFDDSE